MRKPERKIEMPNYSKVGYHSEHPVTRNQKDNKIRSGEGDTGDFRHTMERNGSPGREYQPMNVAENLRPPRDNKIAGMPPHEMDDYGKAENGRGKGSMRNMDDSDPQSPRYGSVKPRREMSGKVRAEGTK